MEPGLRMEDETEMKCWLNLVAKDFLSSLKEDQLDILWSSTD